MENIEKIEQTEVVEEVNSNKENVDLQTLTAELEKYKQQTENLNKALKIERENKKQVKQSVEQVETVKTEQDTQIAELLKRLEEKEAKEEMNNIVNSQKERLNALDVDMENARNKALMETVGLDKLKDFEDEKIKALFEIKKVEMKEKEHNEVSAESKTDPRLEKFIKNMAKAEGISEAEAEKKLNEMF
jgi:hypothetical protein